MKLRHFAAVLSFLTAFGLSVLLVGLPVYKARSSQVPCKEKQPVAVKSETEQQARIREFLEADRQTGRELSADLQRFRNNMDGYRPEKLATLNLVEKMRKVNCDGLPKDFCNAWYGHLIAWESMADLLDKDFNREKFASFELERHAQLNRRINDTYNAMLAAARNHGVDFKY